MYKQTFLAAFLLCLGGAGISSSGDRSAFDRFNFNYAIAGDAIARPLQVFDDGKKTYLQYRPNQDIPAFISSVGGQLMFPTQEGPYTVLNGVPRDFVASMGTATARITHAQAMSNAAQYVNRVNQAAVPTERIQPQVLVASAQHVASLVPRYEVRNDWSSNSYATPLRGDQIAWAPTTSEASKVILFERGSSKLARDVELRVRKIGNEIVGATRVVINAADDTNPSDAGGTERVRVIRNILIAAGVDPSVISSKVGFLFDDQLQRVGNKLFNPTTITWVVQSATERSATARTRHAQAPDNDMSVVAMLREGKISPSQAIQMLQAKNPNTLPATASASQSSQVKPTMPSSWSIRKEDQTIEKMLDRWGREAGWRVIWRGAPTVEITADAARPLSHPNFLQAADYVVTQARSVGYQIKATAYSNQVLVITGE